MAQTPTDGQPIAAEDARRRILRARAEALARLPEQRSDHGEMFVVVFDLGGRKFAVEAIYLQEALPVRHVTPVPCTPDFIAGIVNLRGRVLAVTNLRRVFRLADEPQSAPEHEIAAPPPAEETPTAPPPTEWETTSAETERVDPFAEALMSRASENLDKIVVLSCEGRESAILVDRVRGATAIPLETLGPPSNEGELAKFTHGVTNDGVIVIDAKKLLTSPSIVVR